MASVIVDLQKVGDYFIMAYITPDYRCSMFDKEGRPVAEFCPVGKGPGEAFIVKSIGRSEKAGEIRAFDPQSQKLLAFSADSLVAGKRAFAGEKPKQDFGVLPMNRIDDIRWIRDGQLLVGGNGIVSPKRPERFVSMDRQGQITGRYGEMPYSDDTIEMKVAFSQPRLTISPDGTKMADGSSFGAILETFDVGESIRLRNAAYFIEPDFPHNETGTITSFENIISGFGSMASSDEQIYALYNGTKDPQAMNHIAVFDWNGRFQKLYRTGFPRISHLCYDPVTETLYATAVNAGGEHQLVRFDLPE